MGVINFPLELREFDTEEQAFNACAPTNKAHIFYKNARGKYQVKEIKGETVITEGLDGKPTIHIDDPEVAMMLAESLGILPDEPDDAS